MNKFVKSFGDKKFRYGAFSTLTVIFVIAVLVVINLVVGQLDLKFDLSVDKLYSLSQETKDILAEVTEDVTIYALFRTGQEDTLYKELLDEYQSNSKTVKVVYKDPYLYPQFVEDYRTDETEIPVNSIIVESNRRFKVITASDLASYALDYNTYQYQLQSIDIEPQVTNAIKYVSEDNTSVIYQITNHSELTLSDNIAKQVSLANYDIKELDIFEDEIPEDCSILMATTPERDWTESEAEKIFEYLENDGRAIFFIDFMLEDMPNVSKVLNAYGVGYGKNLVFEGEASRIYQGYPIQIIPIQEPHDITNGMIQKNNRNLLYMATSVDKLDVVKNSVTIEPLLTTSSSSYAKANANAQSLNKEQGDQEGPFNLAVAITDSYYTDKQHSTKLVVVGSTSMLISQMNEYIGGSNGDFILNSMNWLQDKSDSVYIRPKTGSSLSMLIMDGSQIIMLAVGSMIVIPGIIIIIGIVVWLRRRNR